MKQLLRMMFGALALVIPMLATAQQGPVPIVGLMELSGTGATAGTNFDNGVKLAVKEINAAGGILGRKIEYTTNDTQSSPQTAKALAQKAVDQNAYVVMGPVFSGSIIVSMTETRRAEIPNFMGGEAANLTEQGNPYIFRTSFTQSTAMPKLARYIKDTIKANSVSIVWVNNDFGKGGRDAFRKAAIPGRITEDVQPSDWLGGSVAEVVLTFLLTLTLLTTVLDEKRAEWRWSPLLAGLALTAAVLACSSA